ncbi:HNH endonuclease signature motif containing protein [Microbacterium sp. AG1240]|uniref:HNH endonuclease signature motif containing protein n=1 Tax=Microbacterium sp. AG1240 TaxID=2183992 RepID=UPI000EACD122|nr:HNH endonuclease signature motif containing protein [Microbacterium sp. AG1240]
MNDTIDALRDLGSRLGEVVSGALGTAAMRGWSDDEVMAVMDAAATLSRRAEALIAEAAGAVQTRSDSPVAAERMTTRFGCRNVREFVQRVTRVSGRTAGDYVRAGVATASALSVLTGEVLPARYPAMRAALADGAVGVDAVVAVVQTLDSAAIDSHEARTAADAELAAAARGGGAGGGGLPSADELRLQAQVWAAYLDPDGAEPRDEAAQRKRGVTLGRCRDGLVPLRGDLLPDVAAQLKRAIDAIVHPRAGRVHFTDDGDDGGGGEEAECPPDPRTHPQKNHDALATIVTVAARSGQLPTIGGAAPTLVVSVRADDLATGEGVGHIDGIDEPVPMAVVRHVGCTGGIYRTTLARNGRIERVEVVDRVFNAHQRRAITLRDGGCIIPGCDVPAAWCEIHHVREHARGGPTSTDNGVLLCWHHHRTLDTNGWHIRMRGGIPEVRGPSWWDPAGTWRPVTKSPTRIRDQFLALRN